MPILPGTPNNINGIHPLAALVGKGGEGIGMGARMAAAKIAQDTQGVNAFMRSAMQRQTQQQQMQIQQKQFEVSAGMKLEGMRIGQEEAAKNRALQAQQMAATRSIAAARESRMAEESRQKMAMVERQFEAEQAATKTMNSMFQDMMSPGTYADSPLNMSLQETGPMTQVAEDPFVFENTNEKGTGEMLMTEQGPMEVGQAASTMGVPAVNSYNMSPSEAKYRNFLLKKAGMLMATKNTSAAIGAISDVQEMDFAIAQRHEKSGAALDATNNALAMIDRDYNRFGHMPAVNPKVKGMRNLDEIYKTMPEYKVVDLTNAMFDEQMIPGKQSTTQLGKIADVAQRKGDYLRAGKARSLAAAEATGSKAAELIASSFYDEKINEVDRRYKTASTLYVSQAKALWESSGDPAYIAEATNKVAGYYRSTMLRIDVADGHINEAEKQLKQFEENKKKQRAGGASKFIRKTDWDALTQQGEEDLRQLKHKKALLESDGRATLKEWRTLRNQSGQRSDANDIKSFDARTPITHDQSHRLRFKDNLDSPPPLAPTGPALSDTDPKLDITWASDEAERQAMYDSLELDIDEDTGPKDLGEP